MKLLINYFWFVITMHILITWLLAIHRGWKARKSEVKELEVPENVLPPVSVIVPAWNERGTLERNIAALKHVEYPQWEAIIVAGGTDGTYAAAQQAVGSDGRFRLLERGPAPKNAALAQGIQASKFDYVVLLDADNMVTPGWLVALMNPIARGANVAVGNSHPNRKTWITQEEQMWNVLTYHILKLSWIQGDRSIAIRKSLLEQIGGLPTHTYAREDWDIWARLGDLNEKVAFAEGAHLTTDRPATLAESWKHQVRWRRTHLNGMWEQRKRLLRQPGELFRQLYGYLLSVGLAVLILAGSMAIILQPGTTPTVVNLLAMIIVWLGLRKASLAGSVAAYTGDWRWLRGFWMPAINLFINIPASLVALMTSQSLEPYYKGTRHAPVISNN